MKSSQTEALNPIVLTPSLNDTVTKPQLTAKNLQTLVVESAIHSDLATLGGHSVKSSADYLGYEGGSGILFYSVHWDTGEINKTVFSFRADKELTFGDGSKCRYPSPKGYSPDVLLAPMPDKDFWRKVVQDKSQPIFITEGVRKAQSLLSQGFAAIAAPSISTFHQSKKQSNAGEPLEGLVPFFDKDRVFYIVPDSDTQIEQSTADNAKASIKRLEEDGDKHPFKAIRVLVWEYTPETKGIDNLLASKTTDANRKTEIIKLMETSITPQQFESFLDSLKFDHSYNEINESLEDAVIRVIAKEYPDTYYKTPYEWYVKRDGTQLKPATEAEVQVMIASTLRNLIRYSAKGDSRKGLATNRNVEGCFKSFARETQSKTDFKSEPNLLFFENGIFDTNTDTFRNYQKGDISLVNLPYPYTEGADCPDDIYSFWQEKFGDTRLNRVEQKEQLQALVRFYLDFAKHQGWNWFVHITGKSETGKGVFCSMIESLYEPINIAPIGDIADLSDVKESYNYIKETKRVCIGEEIDSYIKKTGGLYSLVTGKKVASRKLNHNTTEEGVDSNVKLLFASTAALGASMTSNEGFSRRIITLKTNGTKGECFVGFIDFRKYAGQLASWALQMPRSKVKETLLKLQKLNADETDLSSNAINRFVAQCFVRVNDEEGRHSEKQSVEQKEMLKCFKAWADYEGVSKLVGSKFYERLDEALGTVFRPFGKVEKVNGKTIRPLKNRYIGLQKAPLLLLNDDKDNDNIPITINTEALIEGQTLRELIKPIGEPEPKVINYEQQTLEVKPIDCAPSTTNPNEVKAITVESSEDLAF